MRYYLFAFFLTSQLYGILPTMSSIARRDLTIELQDPVYKEGVISTDKGGIIKGDELYLQAKKISYTQHKVEAEGDLFFQFKGKVYLGSHLEFDLDSDTGEIKNVITRSDQWYVGGTKLHFNKDGSGVITDGYVTTDENLNNSWGLEAKEVHLDKNATIKAKNISFTVWQKPIFWLPSLSADLKNSSKTPLKYSFKWQGKHGPWLGISYSFHTTEHVKNKLLFDISLQGKLGGGFTTLYKNPDGKERLSLFNYYAYDLKTPYSEKLNRYRFQGKYTNLLLQDRVQMLASYDKLSDQDMPHDYINRGLDSSRAGPTELILSRSEQNWQSSLSAKARINNFQSVKQRLPLFQLSFRPQTLGKSGLILDSRLSAGYLNYRYANNTSDVHDFHSSRVDLSQKLYRHFSPGPLHFTPYIGYKAIGYGNSPQHDSKILAVINAGGEAYTRLVRKGAAIEPYLQYTYTSRPQVDPKKHFLFDMQDGLYRVNTARFGARNFLRFSQDQQLNFDLYARSFFDTPTIRSPIPRVYFDSQWKASSSALYTLKSGWNTERNRLDHFNVRSEVTVSEDIAFALEYRYRDDYAWRKVDPENFMIDTFRSEKRLKASLMSDRRQTLLPHLFIRLTPQMALELLSRHGWGRRHHKRYNEYEAKLITRIANVGELSFNFQHRDIENRFTIDFSLGAKPFSGGTKRLGHTNYVLP